MAALASCGTPSADHELRARIFHHQPRVRRARPQDPVHHRVRDRNDPARRAPRARSASLLARGVRRMAMAPAAAADAAVFSEQHERTLSKVLWRIVPFLFVCYVIAYLDRVNVGVAGLTMNRDLGLSASEFGWSAGLFFFGYFLAEIPSNLALQKVGARLWIARILITWGLLSAGTAFVTGPVSFGVMRFLLGLGEAGFTPGVFLYFTYWFPSRYRGKATAAFLLGIPVANIIGNPLSSSLLALDGVAGMAGWQWLLILEGLPATLLGVVCLFILIDGPE